MNGHSCKEGKSVKNGLLPYVIRAFSKRNVFFFFFFFFFVVVVVVVFVLGVHILSFFEGDLA